MHARFHTFFATGTFSALLLTTSTLAAEPVAPEQQDATGKQTSIKASTSTTPKTAAPKTAKTMAPIAGILDGSNGETVNVHGHHAADGTSAKYMNKIVYLGPLGNRDTLDTPYSVMGVPHDVVVNQQIRNINDMAQYLPSVQLEIRGDPNTSRPQSRGFEADVWSNSRLDGLNVVSTTPYAGEWVDNLQVLNGLSGAMYGPQNPAGMFEYTLKRPTDRRTERLSVGVDSIGTPTVNGDISGRVGKNGWFGYRLNMLHANGTAYTQGSWIRREMVSADFDIHLDEKTVIELDASHYTFVERGTAPGFAVQETPTKAIPSYVSSLPTAPDLSKPYLGQDWSGYNMETNTFLAKIKHEINKDWSFTLGGLYQDAARQSFASNDTLINNTGGYTQTVTAAATANDFRTGSNMAYFNGRVYTGPVKHDLVIGTNGYMSGTYNPTTPGTAVSTVTAADHASIYNPIKVNGKQPYYHGRWESGRITTQSFIIGDTLTFNKHWSILGTLGWSWIDQRGPKSKVVPSPLEKSVQASAAFSPTVSLLYKPTDNQTLYFTYARSVEPGAVANASNSNAYQTQPLIRPEEYEVGYKLRYGKMQFNVAGFRMTSKYAASYCPNGSTCTNPVSGAQLPLEYGYVGTQRNYGVEAQISGEVLPNLSVLAGVTWLDAELINSKESKYNNKEIIGAAPLQANMLLDYRLPASLGSFASGWAFNANVHYMGNRAANLTNTLHTGSYTTLDLGTRYAFNVVKFPWVVRFGVSNATNERYWASVFAGSPGAVSNTPETLYAGLPRIYHFTLSMEF
ncbi:TonB-dependent siderophore receptor [Acetobacter sp. DsW_54]|uniref:TonB-dependent siderophore receptor n=1 Tax=Acetobacter sp. DsW_54 TaxID=1670660 RepID=UPI000A3D62C7|nr:TonB-dependent receptor [Acetobacter sp. DsW_54]OUJ00038.1 TonB-dependent receptor [Acetobacter sp. DsW_54]